MNMKEKSKTQKGITLIALIITIVVLLILAAVAIESIQNDGIIQYAQNATTGYNRAVANEQSKLNEYMDYLKGEPENSLVAMYKAGKLAVGTYVDYNPTTNTDGTTKTYTPDGTTAGSLTGYTTSLQTVTQEDLNWRVLGYDSQKNELLLISGAPTTDGLRFYGLVGYNNYIDVLDDTCSNLYSNNQLGATARSITMNDIDTYLGGSAFTKTTYRGGSSVAEGHGYTASLSSYFKEDAQTGNLTKLDTAETISLTSNAYSYSISDYITDATHKDILLGANTSKPYYNWVASRYIAVSSVHAVWLLGRVGAGSVLASDDLDYRMLYSNREGEFGGNASQCLRPVISLKSNITTDYVKILETAPTEIWSDPLGVYDVNPDDEGLEIAP